jgi:hypothetical protein
MVSRSAGDEARWLHRRHRGITFRSSLDPSRFAPQAMNDPHIEALHYSVRHAEDVDYNKAPPLSRDIGGFTVRIENGRAEVTMNSHYGTVETARAEVEPFLRAWELTAALQFRPGKFELVYDRATIADRNPTPGDISFTEPFADADFFPSAAVHVECLKYPDPPSVGIVCAPAVELMFKAYCLYRENRAKLGEAANFCLTVLEEYPFAPRKDPRGAAAQRYAVARRILNKLSDLAAEKGGPDHARKARGVEKPFTAAERCWLEETMKRLILRAAEIAGDPAVALPQITMADLPSLSRP